MASSALEVKRCLEIHGNIFGFESNTLTHAGRMGMILMCYQAYVNSTGHVIDEYTSIYSTTV